MSNFYFLENIEYYLTFNVTFCQKWEFFFILPDDEKLCIIIRKGGKYELSKVLSLKKLQKESWEHWLATPRL